MVKNGHFFQLSIGDKHLTWSNKGGERFLLKFSGRVENVISFDDRFIVIFWPGDPKDDNQNLICYSMDNKEMWRAHAPNHIKDSWVGAHIDKQGNLRAATFSCMSYKIDLDTGELSDPIFTK